MAGTGLTKDPLEQIIDHIRAGHHFLLSGGAGSGKTYSLVQVLRQIPKIDPTARVACITFTNAAAAEIRSRAGIDNLRVATIHEFFWSELKQFQRQIRETVLELARDKDYGRYFPFPEEGADSVPGQIRYKDYTKLSKGCISHDQVLILAERMYIKYPRLRDLLIDKYQFILVDEYQDTSPHVVRILLEHLQQQTKKNIIGFFGDAMQSIYETGTGDLNEYIPHLVHRVDKLLNRRNPQAIIDLANKLRDDLVQVPSDDPRAPNMEGGTVKQGSVTFLYSAGNDLEKAKNILRRGGWDFSNSETTKELRLTHLLIAAEAGFSDLMNIYDRDPICKLRHDLVQATKNEAPFAPETPFDEVVREVNLTYKSGINKNRTHLEVLLEDPEKKKLYEQVEKLPWEDVRRIHMNKDDLMGSGSTNDPTPVSACPLMCHLHRIQEMAELYDNRQYGELLRLERFQIHYLQDKVTIRQNFDRLKAAMNGTIEDVIICADETGLCRIDDPLNLFLQRSQYLYSRVRLLPYSQFLHLYNYQRGNTVLSTQHKVKGQEFDNVLVVLDNGEWSKYNFRYLLDPSSRKGRSDSVLERTRKLFYVCCTRTKENLAFYYPNAAGGPPAEALKLFGAANCIDVDKF